MEASFNCLFIHLKIPLALASNSLRPYILPFFLALATVAFSIVKNFAKNFNTSGNFFGGSLVYYLVVLLGIWGY